MMAIAPFYEPYQIDGVVGIFSEFCKLVRLISQARRRFDYCTLYIKDQCCLVWPKPKPFGHLFFFFFSFPNPNSKGANSNLGTKVMVW